MRDFLEEFCGKLVDTHQSAMDYSRGRQSPPAMAENIANLVRF